MILDLGSDVLGLVFASELTTTSKNISIFGNYTFFNRVLKACVIFEMRNLKISKKKATSLFGNTITPSMTNGVRSRSVLLL
jgi:hypothetical protein